MTRKERIAALYRAAEAYQAIASMLYDVVDHPPRSAEAVKEKAGELKAVAYMNESEAQRALDEARND